MNFAPLFSLCVTGFVVLFSLIIVMKKKPNEKPIVNNKRIFTKEQLAASELTNILDIKDKFLYSRDGHIFTYLKITPISLDLLSEREKEVISSILSAELSREIKPFKLIALSRPVDITPLLDEYAVLLSLSSDEKQRELLRLETEQMKQYMNCGEVVERQFFIALWDQYYLECETDMLKRTQDFMLSFHAANIGCEILAEDKIIRLINMIHNPAFIHLEDTDWHEHIPLIIRKEDSH